MLNFRFPACEDCAKMHGKNGGTWGRAAQMFNLMDQRTTKCRYCEKPDLVCVDMEDPAIYNDKVS